MNPQKKSIPKSNQTNSKMPYPIQPYPSLPLSIGQSKKKKPKELRTPNPPIHHDPQTQSHHNPPQPAMIHIDSKPNQCNRTWKTHKLIKPTPDLRDPQPTTHTRLERATTHAELDAPMNHEEAMIHREDEKLGVGNDGKREMGWESSNRVRRKLQWETDLREWRVRETVERIK